MSYTRTATINDDILTVRITSYGQTVSIRRWALMTSAAKMPQKCWGKYRNVAVVEIHSEGQMPSAIDSRRKNVLAIPFYRGKLNVGKTEACAYNIALADAQLFLMDIANGKNNQ